MKPLDPPSIHPPFAAYSHGVEVRPRRLVVTSGQLGIAADGTVPVSAEAQAAQCLCNIEAILEEAGLTRQHVLRLNAYVTDRAHMAPYMRARDAWLISLDVQPASTLMVVSGFSRPEFLVEVEAMAAEEI